MNRPDTETGTFACLPPERHSESPTGTFAAAESELSVESALQLEEVCDSFEAEWRPDIWAAATPPALLRSLQRASVNFNPCYSLPIRAILPGRTRMRSSMREARAPFAGTSHTA